MPLSACSSGVAVTALVALLLLPAQYYLPVPGWSAPDADERGADAGALRAAPLPAPATPPSPPAPPLDLVYFPTLDLVFTLTLLLLGALTYLCEWVQRKLMERRIVKLNQYLGASVERLRAWDAQQEQLEATLRTAQTAAAEYNLLLYLLLRQHRCLAPPAAPAAPSAPPAAPAPAPAPRHAHHQHHCLFDKEADDEFAFLRTGALDT